MMQSGKFSASASSLPFLGISFNFRQPLFASLRVTLYVRRNAPSVESLNNTRCMEAIASIV